MEANGTESSDTLSTEQLRARDIDRRALLIAAHLLLALGVFALWAAADAWQALTGLGVAAGLSVATAIVAGVVLGTLVHEWSHLFGAWSSGAVYTIPARVGLFVFGFDFQRNTLQQFYAMSYAGQAGSWLAVLLLYLAVPMDSAGRVMLVCAAAAAAVYSGLVEWPVLQRTRQSGQPLQELARIDRALLWRSARIAVALGLLLWVLAI